MRVKFCVVLFLSLLLCVPHLAMAAGAGMHYFDCKECHLAGLPVNQLVGNVCLKCHDTMAGSTDLNPGAPHGTSTASSDGRFAAADPSNLYNTAAGAVEQTSHNWYAPSVNAEAGAVEPSRTLHPTMFGMRGRNTGSVNCARCHDPHGAYDLVNNPNLLVASADRLSTMTANDLCTACHANFAGAMSLPGNNGLLTHPLLNSAQLAAVQADGAKAPNYIDMAGTLPLYNATTPYANNVQLIEGGVSCMSCHGLHFTDSSTATTDGPATVGSGDGLLLRSDGPTSTGATRNDTAQLRSNLCQSCHTYKMHGNTVSTHNVGCLDCHGGHSYNGGTPNLYVLASQSPDAVPTRFEKVYQGDVQVNYPVYDSALSTRGESGAGSVAWDDDIVGTANGFCEVCHGDVNDPAVGGLAYSVDQHKTTGADECSNCHKHDDVGFAFKLDASAISCGGCHGFPPYKDVPGNRVEPYDAADGGYAISGDLSYDYLNDSGHYKPESTTAHRSHAGHDLKEDGGLAPLPNSDKWYFYGSTGLENCKLCHGPDASNEATGGHQEPGLLTTTFRNVPFDGIAFAPGQTSPSYSSAGDGSCDNVYCHSVGGPRTGDSTRDYSLGMGANTPNWAGTGGTDGYNSILIGGTGEPRCQVCHGNDITSMGLAGNTSAHNVHIDESGTPGTYNYACGVCHENSAIDKDTLSANATDHRVASGGLHVNGEQNVVFNSTVLYNALAVDKNSYNGTTGTCSVYCHDAPEPGFLSGKGRTADWDVTGTMTCNSCHADQTTTFTGSHQRHSADANGPQLTCAECHGTGADSGTHAGHVDGILDYVTLTPGDEALFGTDYPQNICNHCHGYDDSETEVALEVQPLWGQPSTTDCATCHAGSICGASFTDLNSHFQDPLHLSAARAGGHNRPVASGNYNSGNLPANLDCDACHITDSASHWDNVNGSESDMMLRTGQDGYNSAYLGGLENNYCANCHGDAPGHPTGSAAGVRALGIKTHSAKKCVACHDVHGNDINIQMIWNSRVLQNQHDDTFGQYRTTNVEFTNNSDFTGIGLNSYDEDDNDDGAATENNSDDICAVCHSDGTIDANFAGNPVSHNNIEGNGTHSGSDNLGIDCFLSCHAVHNDPGGAFLASGGTSCNGCHGYPPVTAAHNLHAVEEGSRTAIDTDDQSDCENCHTGASSYTYNTGDDQGNSLNHGDAAGRRTLLNSAIGFGKDTGNKWTCTKACHNTDATDGFWYTWDDVGNAGQAVALRLPIDSDGIACDKCHYYAGSPSSAGNVQNNRSEPLSSAHNDHFDNGKTCGDCHDITGAQYNNGSPLMGSLLHINDRTGADRGAIYNGMALALQDEAGFDEGGGVRDVLASLTYNDANTCASAGGVGCHAGSTTVNWADTIDLGTNTGCLECHTVNGNPSYDPFSGLHTNTTDPTVTGNSHDDSFYNGDGAAGVADCITCHTSQPTITAADHIDGTLDDGVNKITVYANAGYDWTTDTCATVAECHSANQSGANWSYRWNTAVFNNDGTECANCHGRWTDWRTGVTHRMDGPVQTTHETGATYGCKDCHGLEASTNNYAFTSGTDDWNANAGETSNHGDGTITINYNTTQFGRNGGGLSGCAECHAAYDGIATGQFSFTTTTWTNSSVLGDAPTTLCSSCHGGTTAGPTDVRNYWPDDVNAQDNGSKDNSGAHYLHMLRLAQSVYNLDAVAGDDAATIQNLLTDNTANYSGLTSEDKQRELCAYCHNNPGVNPGHNDDALPAETLADANEGNTSGQGYFELWEVPRVDRDSADFDTTGAGSCYVSSCHYDRATDANATNYGWYAGNSTSCEICHDPDNVDTNVNAGGLTHQEHVNSATLTGRTITCDDCHQTATENVAWGAPGVAPNDNHINNTFMDAGAGSVTYTYNLGSDKSCNTNECHNIGDGSSAPATAVYPWDGGPLADCSICHLDPPDTDAHPVHMASSYVDCLNCHTPGNDTSNHIKGSVTYNTTTITSAPGDGSCANTCHVAGDPGDWQGTFTTLACTECHTASASIADAPTSGLHVTTVVTTHDGTLQGGNCVNCHDASAPVPAATHGDGNLDTWADGGYTFHANVVGYNAATGCMAALGCHTDDGQWRRKWAGFVDLDPTAANAPGDPVCGNCHGSSATFVNDPTEWRWDEATNSDHTDPYNGSATDHDMDNHDGCTTCHGWGDAAYDANWQSTSPGHGDGNITMNGPVGTGTGYNAVTNSCDAAGCHNGPNYNIDNDSGFTVNYGDFGAGGGGPCDSCHGNQAGNYWPDGDTTFASQPTADDQPGYHEVHVNALTAKGNSQTQACTFCHGPEPGTGSYHFDGGSATLPKDAAWFYKRIIGGADDTDGVFNTSGSATSTCSNIDCHFNNAYTPHWYDSDNIAPDAVTNLAVAAGVNPRSVKVTYNSPGADAGLDNTTAYRYDVRISDVSAADAANYNSATSIPVGGLPASYLRNEFTEVFIENLDDTQPYWVAVRAQDTEGLWGTIATAGSITPSADTDAPMFYGADKALPGDEGGSINLYWTEAEDHSMYDLTTLNQTPIRYEIWLKSEARGDLDMTDNTGYNSAILWDGAQTFYTGNAIELEGSYTHTGGGTTTIQNDITYQMGVRACDIFNNCETNTNTVSVTPAAASKVPQTVHDYVSSGGYLLTRDGTPGGAAGTDILDNSAVSFYGSSQAHGVIYYVDNFTIQYTEDRDASAMTARLGKWTGTCGGFVATATASTSSRATAALLTFKFGAITPVTAAAGESFCIEVSTPHVVNIAYGTAATRGDASVVEEIVNNPPNPIQGENISLNGAIVTATWTQPADDGDGLTTEENLHYDIYGSNQNGAAGTWNYVIAEDQDWNDTDVVWDTQADGITSGTLAIKIRPGDGFAHTSDGLSIFTNIGSADAVDKIAPGQVTDLRALARPKKGTVELRWTCPGDDYGNNGRADHYEIRYSTAPISNFNTAILVDNATPYPDFGGHVMAFEVTGLPLAPSDLYFALKVFDERDNASPMSNVAGPVTSGPSCGMCHTTGPSVVESEGNHKLHGFTLNDCDKCHDDGTDAPSTFGLDHQDGVLKMGYGPGGAQPGIIDVDRMYYTDDGTPGGTLMYDDTDGYGGFGDPATPYVPAGDGIDNGSCFNFGAMGVGGCHGPAGSDPDGAATQFPLFETPDWTSTANLDCGRCHGNPNRDENATNQQLDPYGRDFDATLANGGVVPDQIIGSPGADNRGGWDDDPVTGNTVEERKYIGQHEKHLNYSFRFSKGDSCNLCHYGHYDDINDLDGKHGDGIIDVQLDTAATGTNAHYNAAGTGVAGQCFSMDPYNCHPTAESPAWDTDADFPCIGCHTMGNDINKIGHYTDTSTQTGASDVNGSAPWYEGNPGNCTWCHFAGHPLDDVGGAALILPNNPQVGINYKSGGIHLRKQPGGANGTHASYNTQAELCWGCHDAQTPAISEWGADGVDGPTNNSAILPANGNNYDFGSVTTSNWTTATWSSSYSSAGNNSATPHFEYKTGPIMSTHSTNITNGDSTVTLNSGQYVESTDAVADLQCHNCHDVHNMNFAKGDNMSGNPYLRGSWLSNPYKEDGAPRGPGTGNTTFTATYNFGPVPRGGVAYNEMGGYQIDQNNGHTSGPPTKGWVAQTAGGLCLLCHGANGVDGLDQTTGEDLWITAGRNGHSNSALGGTAAALQVTDIFSFNDRHSNSNNDPVEYTGDYGIPAGTANASPGNPAMGYVHATGISSVDGSATEYRGDGFRSNWGFGWSSLYASPDVTPTADFPYNQFDWGVTQDSTGTINKGYHAFSCSKCHNPHASRLPKLMITNCLDTKQNTWDDQWVGLTGTSTQSGSSLSADNSGMRLSNTTSAQNCHRVGDPGQGGTGAGWNLVTPRNILPNSGI